MGGDTGSASALWVGKGGTYKPNYVLNVVIWMNRPHSPDI